MSVKDIAAQLGVSKSTASLWVRGFPLSDSEKLERMAKNGLLQGGWNRKSRGDLAAQALHLPYGNWSNNRKGAVAEAAVTHRFLVHGFDVFAPVSGADRLDRIVRNPKSGNLSKVQVRWTREGKRRTDGTTGSPVVSLRCYDGRYNLRKYSDSECDVLVGYDFVTDIAYVFLMSDLTHLEATVTVSPAFAERWDKVP